MSTSIGSNFDYKGPEFLDARQNLPTSETDLKNWDILVPEGFKVFVEGKWYIYNSSINDPKTGKFTPLFSDVVADTGINVGLSQKGAAEMGKVIQVQLKEITDELWPLEIKITSGGGNYEKGRNVPVNISWTVTHKGKNITPTKATVNGSATGIDTTKLSYTGSSITTNTTFTVAVEGGNLQTQSTKVNYVFGNKRFFGTSAKSTLTSGDVISLAKSDFGTNNKLSSTSFDCTGGKYPWFCIPATIYNASEMQVWIGGLRVTDLVIQDIAVTNNYNDTTLYKCIRLGSIQTGNLAIELR